ncbi:hypothetical protein [Streptomyces alanosinicus]|uniref:Uncharacterized protein n=1 Tax=Streptomyces alanosinicus TaxID=68171 RepID=A0A919D035_9ACTN|nr:hypothetical protein [Streptomyces alanosinicus]GHE00308.1 hypothetical protein GCM10010339_14960 [Streptomyces alanosinicus]
MTQSGQGEEPSARPAREGIVLPSDGGEPLLPGMSGEPAPAAPAGGQAWGGSWGPEQQADRQGGQGWPPAAAQQWHTPDAPHQPPPAANPGPLPPEGAPAPSYGQSPSYDHPGAQGMGQGIGQGGGYGAGQQPGYGAVPEPYQQPELPPQHHQRPELPPQPYQQPQHQQQYPQPPGSAAPLPPALPDAYPAAAPLPPADEGATQYIPPVPTGSADGATQYIPPVPAAPADEGATQYIPPVAPGALPPESAGEETRYLGQAPHRQQPAPASSDAEATQYIPPYAAQAQGGDRQPPAEFDNLFRGGPAGGDSPAGSTQQLPRMRQPEAYPAAAQPPYGRRQPSYGAPQPSYDADYDDEPRRGRSRVPLIAAVGVGIVVIGVGAGVLLSDGGGKDQGTDGKTVAATAPATQGSGSAAADPARQQAVELDKLLSDSGSSRASVIKSVADVKRCDNLDEAASNLHDAATQRSGLVTRLGKLSVDKLPDNAALTAALTRAWQASAAADNHYAAWAGQAKQHKVCRKGHARSTNEAQAGNRASGTASEQKVKAAALWNAIARKYGLTQRQPTQL